MFVLIMNQCYKKINAEKSKGVKSSVFLGDHCNITKKNIDSKF